MVFVIRTTTYYVPDDSICLFSQQTYVQENNNKVHCLIKGTKATLELPYGGMLHFSYSKGGNLPLMLTYYPTIVELHFQDADFISSVSPCNKFLSIPDQTNQNIRLLQNYLLLIHHKLGRARFQWRQKICQIPKGPS